MTDKERTLTVLFGAVRAARAALQATNPTVLGDDGDITHRVEVIDEELRKLARDIAKRAGL
jgi:hypothetical protein